jgi:3-oxoacyl-[acyl-carrier-protein] synthase II
MSKINLSLYELLLGSGIILCIEKALSQSMVAREDVNYINAHATSTPAGDIKEYQAIVHCFGQNKEVDLIDTLLIVIIIPNY